MVNLGRGRCHEFVESCEIVKQNQAVGLLDLEPQQREVLDAWAAHRFLMVVKYRQAKISTVLALALLGMAEYTEGIQGLFIAEKQDTTETVWSRALHAYNKQSPAVKIPLASGLVPGVRKIDFIHGATVRGLTGGGKAPAIGNSPDRVVITEYPDVPDHDLFNEHFFPTVNARPHARVAMEHTPGSYQGVPHNMWLNTLAGKGRFFGVFLRWYLDRSITPFDDDGNPVPCKDLHPTNEELSLIEECPGITKAHLMFRRLTLDGEFHGDVRLFNHKYPRNPYDGWTSETSPKIPEDALKALLALGTQVRFDEEHVYEEPRDDDTPYAITADPAGWGETGDPSALTVWDCWSRSEVVCWSGREDPEYFASRILRLQKKYGVGRTLIAVESNKGECLSSLITRGAKNLYYHDQDKPGFPASTQTNADALTDLVDLLRKKEISIRTLDTLHQLLQWDGTGRKKKAKTAEGTHHFDRAVTCRIAAYLFKRMGWGSRPSPITTVRGMTVRDLDVYYAKQRRRSKVLGVDAC